MPFVAVPLTKHRCLQAVNLYGALCCPDFPPATDSERQTNLL